RVPQLVVGPERAVEHQHLRTGRNATHRVVDAGGGWNVRHYPAGALVGDAQTDIERRGRGRAGVARWAPRHRGRRAAQAKGDAGAVRERDRATLIEGPSVDA